MDLHCHSEARCYDRVGRMVTYEGSMCCKMFLKVAYGKNENSGKPNAFGEHSQRFKPEEAPTLLTSAPASGAEKPTEV